MKIQYFLLYYGLYRRSGKSVLLSARMARCRILDLPY